MDLGTADGSATVFFKHRHENALLALTEGRIVPHVHPPALETSRIAAIQLVMSKGYIWPAVLDEEFPATTEGGVQYETVSIEWVSFL